ncbi:MAG: hypothetical protein V1722_04235 [Candidatus Micrarchaeota archaeon]
MVVARKYIREAAVGLHAEVSFEPVSDGKRLEFTFSLTQRLGKRSAFEFFVPLTDAQVREIATYRQRVPENRALARAAVTLDNETRTLTWRSFYPHGLERQTDLETAHAPIRRGIATALHYAITKFLADNYELHHIRHDNRMPLEREEHLRKMGINPRAHYKITQYYEIVKRYAERKLVTS